MITHETKKQYIYDKKNFKCEKTSEKHHSLGINKTLLTCEKPKRDKEQCIYTIKQFSKRKKAIKSRVG